MPVANAMFTGGGDSSSSLQNIVSLLGTSVPELRFVDKKTGRVTLTREYIETILDDYSKSNPTGLAAFTKWLGIDTSAEKNIRKYEFDLKTFLLETLEQAKTAATAGLSPEAGAGTPAPMGAAAMQPGFDQPQSPTLGNKLPVEEM